MNNNTDYFRKGLENIRRSRGKLESSFAEMQAELKALKSWMNNAEEQISDLEAVDRNDPIGTADRKQMKEQEGNTRNLWDNTGESIYA